MLSPWVHAAQVVRSQVFCKKAKLKFSSPGGTTLRPFQGLWLVPMEPNWVQQDPNGTKLGPAGPPGGLAPPQNGCIWYY